MVNAAPSAFDVPSAALGGKWKMPILRRLHETGGPLRFTELKRAVPRISSRVLALQLRELVAHGLLSRYVHPFASPVRVEYALTESGKTLEPILEALRVWSTAPLFRNRTPRLCRASRPGRT
jgi:DNA-binding HxlR family transcriptional regulator